MSFNLSKNQPFELTKNRPSLRRIFLGLGWDPVKPPAAKGFFGALRGGGAVEAIDLDSSCLMFDQNKRLVDTVWFRQLKSLDGSVKHSGDNLTGEGDGDDESIHIDLTRVPASVQSLVFTINSFRGQTFEKVEAARCRIVDEDTGVELAQYGLSGKNPFTGQIMAKVFRTASGWSVEALGIPSNGRMAADMVADISAQL